MLLSASCSRDRFSSVLHCANARSTYARNEGGQFLAPCPDAAAPAGADCCSVLAWTYAGAAAAVMTLAACCFDLGSCGRMQNPERCPLESAGRAAAAPAELAAELPAAGAAAVLPAAADDAGDLSFSHGAALCCAPLLSLPAHRNKSALHKTNEVHELTWAPAVLSIPMAGAVRVTGAGSEVGGIAMAGAGVGAAAGAGYPLGT